MSLVAPTGGNGALRWGETPSTKLRLEETTRPRFCARVVSGFARRALDWMLLRVRVAEVVPEHVGH